MLFKRRFLRKKLKELRRLQAEDPHNLKVYLQAQAMVFDMPPGRFDRYTRRQGKQIDMICIRKNVARLLMILEESRLAVIERESLPRGALQDDSGAIVQNLDDWLVTNDGYNVPPQTAWEMLNERLSGLLSSIEKCQQPAFITSYRRKLTYVFHDTVTTMEALLTVAL